MLKIKGTVVYPQQLEEILMHEPEIVNYVIEASKDNNECDALKIMIALQERNDNVVERIKERIKARIRTTPAIEVLASQEIQKIWYRHGSRKPEKFVDLRPQSPANI